MRFKGNIIITDPCYIVKDDDKWNAICDAIIKARPRGEGNAEILKETLGVDALIAETIYGDWGCTVYEEDCAIGEFCADAGMVCVMSEEDVLKINPTFKEDYGDWCYTLIEDFDGDVVIENIGENDGYCADVRVVGTGNIEFYSMQTAL